MVQTGLSWDGGGYGLAPKSRECGGLGGYKTRVCGRGGSALFCASLLPLRGQKAESFAFQEVADFSLQ